MKTIIVEKFTNEEKSLAVFGFIKNVFPTLDVDITKHNGTCIIKIKDILSEECNTIIDILHDLGYNQCYVE